MSAISYTIRRSARTRALRIQVHPGGAVVVSAPHHASERAIDDFVKTHARWIAKASLRMAHYIRLPVSGRRDYLQYKEQARVFITQRVEKWNAHYGFTYQRIAIKDTKRLWGSCSRKGNLNFSYTLLFLPPELADYVVIHELCHLKEHNHAPRFWALVAQTMPHYKHLRRQLARYVR